MFTKDASYASLFVGRKGWVLPTFLLLSRLLGVLVGSCPKLCRSVLRTSLPPVAGSSPGPCQPQQQPAQFVPDLGRALQRFLLAPAAQAAASRHHPYTTPWQTPLSSLDRSGSVPSPSPREAPILEVLLLILLLLLLLLLLCFRAHIYWKHLDVISASAI